MIGCLPSDCAPGRLPARLAQVIGDPRAILTMDEPLGDRLGDAAARTYDSAWKGGDFWQYTCYPGELASGERPAFQGHAVVSSRADHTLAGQSGFVLGHSNEFTPGQSGGAVWGWWPDEPWPRVIGVGSTIGSTTVEAPRIH